ncbi:MAG: hypothetical protein FJ014_20460 [Chloroflexi bacterium]|nr:hypothetical protein [Chloroflexota bacterium]
MLSTLIVIALLAPVGCTASPQPTPKATPPYGEAQPLVDLAKTDLQERLGVSFDKIAVQSVEATEFPDTSLGVPEPGHMYAQVITPGYVIELVVDGTLYTYHGSGERVVFVPNQVALTTLPPALGLQTLDGQGFALHYPANARLETYEDYLRILGPEIAIRPADADWGWWGWAYEMDIWVFDNPDGLSAADWARQHILSQWQEAAGGPFTGPVNDNGQINEDRVAEVSVGGLAAFQADWFGGDSTRRAIYVTDGKRVVSLIFNLNGTQINTEKHRFLFYFFICANLCASVSYFLYPVENNPIARVEEDLYALILSTFRFSE